VQPTLVDTAVGPIELAEAGAGPAVLFVHGMPGDWSQAAPLARELADDHRVLLVSRPGYGRTPLAVGPTPRSTATAYRALLDALAIERAAVVGISGGGPSAYAFAAHERERCDRLVLACAVNSDTIVVPPLLRFFHAIPVLPDVLGRWDRNRKLRAAEDPGGLVARALSEANEVERARIEDDPVALEWLVEFVTHNLRVTEDMGPFRHDLRTIVRHQRDGGRQEWPDGPTVPTLIMHGDADEVVDIQSAHAYERLIPGAEMAVYAGAGHGFLFTFRRESMARLRAFIDAVPAT
jgi:pimeloyl-ACP methyl ester carboxylesterase